LADHLETELRRNDAVNLLLEEKRERFVSVRRLTSCVKPVVLPIDCICRLVERYPSRERWLAAKLSDLAKLLAEEGEDPDVAELLLKKVRANLLPAG
jgi:hypothetical protein